MIQVKEVIEKEFIDKSNTETKEVVKHPIWGINLLNVSDELYYIETYTTKEKAEEVANHINEIIRRGSLLRLDYENIKAVVVKYFIYE